MHPISVDVLAPLIAAIEARDDLAGLEAWEELKKILNRYYSQGEMLHRLEASLVSLEKTA
jgi:hypothetical protein